MTDQVNITQEMLDDVAEYITTKLLYLAMGTGSSDVTLTTGDVANPVAIEGGSRNHLRDNLTLNGNLFTATYIITSLMPVTQPVDYRQIGIHDGPNDTSGIFWAHTLAVNVTKDNNSQHRIIVSGRIIELESTDL